MENKGFKLKNRALLLALAGGAFSLAQQVHAVPVSATFDMTCPFPLIGDKVIGVQVESDIPATLPIDQESGEFPINVISTIGGDAALGLDLVSAKSLDGSAVSYVTISSDSGADPRAIEVPITLATTPSDPDGFQLPGSGASPSLVPVASEVGTATITIAGIDLDISTYLADGSPAPAPLGNFQATCVLPEGGVELAQLEIAAPPPPSEPEIEVDATSVDFGSVEFGSEASATVSIANTGDGELLLDAVTIDGDEAFAVTGDCGVVASGGSCDLTVTMDTAAEGSLAATLNIASNDADEPTTAIALSGEVAAVVVPTAVLAVSVSELDLGSVQLGDTASDSVTVSNAGDADLTVTGVSSDNADFTASTDCGVVLAGESCGLFVEFNPSVAGAATATILVESDAGSLPVAVSASAASEAEPSLDFPLTLEFGDVVVGESSTKALELSNNGSAILTIEEVSVEPDNGFSLGANDCDELAPGETCAIDVTFAPTESGDSSMERVTIISDDPEVSAASVTLVARAVNEGDGPVDPDWPQEPGAYTGSLLGSAVMESISGSIPLSGRFSIENGNDGETATGSLSLDQTEASIQAIKFLPVVASVTFGESSELSSVSSGLDLNVVTEVAVSMPKIAVKLFGLLSIPIGGGAACSTAEPVTVDLSGPILSAGNASQLSGDFSLGAVEKCGLLTPAISSVIGAAPASVQLDLMAD